MNKGRNEHRAVHPQSPPEGSTDRHLSVQDRSGSLLLSAGTGLNSGSRPVTLSVASPSWPVWPPLRTAEALRTSEKDESPPLRTTEPEAEKLLASTDAPLPTTSKIIRRAPQDREPPDSRRLHAGDTVVAQVEDLLSSGSLGAKWGFPTLSGPESHISPKRPASDLVSALPDGLLGQYPGIRRILYDRVASLYEPLHTQVLETLPTDLTMMDIGVVRYFSHVAWDCAILHPATFMAEYGAFKVMLGLGMHRTVDPMWLGLLFMVLSLAFDSYDSLAEIGLAALNIEQLCTFPSKFRSAAAAALECGDWLGEPRLRTVQVLVLLTCHYQYNPSVVSVDKCDHYSSSAVRICRRLGLHRLNEDPTSLPEGLQPDNDPAFVGASTHFWRQQALLALSASLSVDNENHRAPPSFDAGEVISPRPDNINLDQLSFDSRILPRPQSSLVDTTYVNLRYQRSVLQRQSYFLSRDHWPLTFEELSAMDERLMAICQRYDLGSSPAVESKAHAWARTHTLQLIYAKRINFLRACISPAYAGRLTYEQEDKVRKALQLSARHLLQSAIKLYDLSAPITRSCFHFVHIQSAVFVIFRLSWSKSALCETDSTLVARVLQLFKYYSTSIRPAVYRTARIAAKTTYLLWEGFEYKSRFVGSEESFPRALERIRYEIKMQQDETLSAPKGETAGVTNTQRALTEMQGDKNASRNEGEEVSDLLDRLLREVAQAASEGIDFPLAAQDTAGNFSTGVSWPTWDPNQIDGLLH